jgi:hypothetical protein
MTISFEAFLKTLALSVYKLWVETNDMGTRNTIVSYGIERDERDPSRDLRPL